LPPDNIITPQLSLLGGCSLIVRDARQLVEGHEEDGGEREDGYLVPFPKRGDVFCDVLGVLLQLTGCSFVVLQAMSLSLRFVLTVCTALWRGGCDGR